MKSPLKGSQKDVRGLPLTDVQCKVIALRADGLGVKEIGYRLRKSVKTAEFHYENARRRIGLRDLALVTKWALRHGLTGPGSDEDDDFYYLW